MEVYVMYSSQRDWMTFWDCCQHRTYYWKIVVSGVYPFDMRRVHPWQQSYVARVYNIAKDIPTIKRLILFGSSISPFCTMYSDLDIAYEGTLGEQYLAILNSCPNGVDLLDITTVSNPKLKNNIEKGLRII